MKPIKVQKEADAMGPTPSPEQDQQEQPPQASHPRWQRLLLAAAVAVALASALVIRLLATGPLWLDEAQSVAIARLPLPQLFDALRADGSPPLYYVLLHGWIGLWGQATMPVRALSVLFNTVTVALLWVLVRHLGGSKALAWVCVLIAASLPWMARFGSETRMYSLVCLLVVTTGLACVRLWRTPGFWALFSAGLSWAALLLTHYWALFMAAAVLIVVAGGVVLKPSVRRSLAWQVLALVMAGLFFSPWVPSMLFQVRRTGAPWARRATFRQLASFPHEWAGGVGGVSLWLTFLLVILMALGILGGWVSLHTHPWLPHSHARWLAVVLVSLVSIVMLIALVVALLTNSALSPRYSAVVVPLVIMIVGLGVAAFPVRLRLPTTALLVVGGLVASAMVAPVLRTQAGEAGAALNAYAQPGDVVIICPDQLAPSLARQLSSASRKQLEFVIIAPRSDSAQLLRSAPVEKLAPGEDTIIDRVDWVDYTQRVDALSAQLTADQAREQAHNNGAAVWVLTSGVYKTHHQVCAQIKRALSQAGWHKAPVVVEDPKILELSTLLRWTAPAP